MTRSSLLPAERAALTLLSRVESDCIGEINDENKLAAAVIYARLCGNDLVSFERSAAGPVYRITPAGRARLREEDAGSPAALQKEGRDG